MRVRCLRKDNVMLLAETLGNFYVRKMSSSACKSQGREERQGLQYHALLRVDIGKPRAYNFTFHNAN